MTDTVTEATELAVITGGGEVEPHDPDLGGAAESWGPEESGTEQPALVGEGAKVTFKGVNYQDVNEELGLLDEVVFLVRGRVVEKGTRVLKDGHKQPFAKVDVSSVVVSG